MGIFQLIERINTNHNIEQHKSTLCNSRFFVSKNENKRFYYFIVIYDQRGTPFSCHADGLTQRQRQHFLNLETHNFQAQGKHEKKNSSCGFISCLGATVGLNLMVRSLYALNTEVSRVDFGRSHSLLCDAPFTEMTVPMEPLLWS